MNSILLLAASLLTSAPWQTFTAKDGDKPWTYTAKDEDIAKGGWVKMSFTASWKDVVKERPFYAWSGIVFAAHAYDAEGKKLFLKTVNLGDGSRDATPGEMKFLLPKDSRRFNISFGPQFSKGSFELKGVSVDLIPLDPSRPSIVHKGRSHEYEERGKPPVNPAKLPADANFGLFRIDSPRMTFDRFAPEASQMTESFSLAAAPGETANLHIGIFAGRDVEISASVSGFTSKSGFFGWRRTDLKAKTSVFRAHNRPNNAGRGQTYWIAPEVLMPIERLSSVKAGTTAQTLVQFRVPRDAKPGKYEGTVAFSCGPETREAKVSLTVLPVVVPYPDPSEYQQILHVGWYADRPEILEQVCRDAKARGCESLLIACQYGKGRIVSERKDGKLAIRSFNRFDHALAAFRAAGMRGTFYVHFSDKLEVAIAKALGVKMPDGHGEQTAIVPEMETAEFKAAQVEALRLLKARAGGDINLAVLAMDEPDNGARIPRAVWEIERIKESGIPSALYAGARSYDNTHPDIIIGQVTPRTPVYEHFKKEVAKHGSLLCRYGGSGSYGFAFGGLMPSRLLHGWGEFLMPECKGHTIWTVQVDETYDLASVRHFSSFGTVYQRLDDGSLLTSLQLEGCYEGFLDYAYLKELEKRLKLRSGTAAARRISAEFEKMKAEMDSVVPYGLDADLVIDPEKVMKKKFTNADAVAARNKIAEWICELD